MNILPLCPGNTDGSNQEGNENDKSNKESEGDEIDNSDKQSYNDEG